ncbi:hypothetical protein ACPESL_07555 [Psychrobacter pocilloporae]|uniref:hypothetical protein n=1 Tax=Psychrobacter pocilloporae TaxID=1775882 RepID=UPI003C305CE4
MGIGWYKSIKKILKEEPELWLSYIHGQQLENVTHLTGIKPRYRGLPLQLMKFSYLLIKTWRPFSSNDIDNSAQYFFFAGTSNQMDSLDTTIDALRAKGAIVAAVAPLALLNQKERKERYVPLTLNSTDIIKTIFLLLCRGHFLHQELKKLHPEANNWWFSNFCFIYVYLAYFQRVLPLMPLECVITANDHNSPNRCMLAVAHELSIKTAYLQHASVSPLFPALRVSYAFLDGQSALDVYRQCEKNQPKTNRQVPTPKIFLSGQKKSTIGNGKKNIKTDIKTDIKNVGIALNALDDIGAAIDFIHRLVDLDYNLVVRWHPGQAERDVERYRKEFAENSHIIISEPKFERVSDFLSSINWLIAGNSSIHLEAALAGVIPIYYELAHSNVPDYYGYVKNGLATNVSSIEGINDLINADMTMDKDSRESIRYYSATYRTEWEGREGELVAQCLLANQKEEVPCIKVLRL